jgi:hypothetical protein
MKKDPEREYRKIVFDLPIEIWEKVRGITFQKRISFTRLYEEFTRLIYEGDPDAHKVMQTIVMNKMIDGGKLYRNKRGELDKETIYDILRNEGVI